MISREQELQSALKMILEEYFLLKGFCVVKQLAGLQSCHLPVSSCPGIRFSG